MAPTDPRPLSPAEYLVVAGVAIGSCIFIGWQVYLLPEEFSYLIGGLTLFIFGSIAVLSIHAWCKRTKTPPTVLGTRRDKK